MNSVSNKVGVIEIGSRAVRLLIAEISPFGRLTVASSDWKETGLAHAQASGGHSFDDKVKDLVSTVRAFQKKAAAYRTSRLCVFATEAVRNMSTEHLTLLREGIPQLEVIDRSMEARCALLGAVSPFEAPKKSEDTFIIDQGTGSMETGIGRISPSGATLSQYESYSLGTQILVDILGECGGDLKKFQAGMRDRIAGFNVVNSDSISPIILGSAATKIAWIKVRGSMSDRYDPKMVHGQTIEVSMIDNLVSTAIAKPDMVRRIIDPVNPESREFETVVTGLIAIRLFMERFGKKSFMVSAYGPRYGVVWMAGKYRELGFDVSSS